MSGDEGRDEPPGAWAMVSDLRVDPAGGPALEHAFRNRLGEVDEGPGFIRLDVWSDAVDAGRYMMVTWWTSREACRDWLRSDAHDRSHARMPDGSAAPTGVSFRRYQVVAQ